mgnify:CR=1 FL=1
MAPEHGRSKQEECAPGRPAAGPRLAELDLNPVLAGPQGVTAVDWLMVLD